MQGDHITTFPSNTFVSRSSKLKNNYRTISSDRSISLPNIDRQKRIGFVHYAGNNLTLLNLSIDFNLVERAWAQRRCLDRALFHFNQISDDPVHFAVLHVVLLLLLLVVSFLFLESTRTDNLLIASAGEQRIISSNWRLLNDFFFLYIYSSRKVTSMSKAVKATRLTRLMGNRSWNRRFLLILVGLLIGTEC